LRRQCLPGLGGLWYNRRSLGDRGPVCLTTAKDQRQGQQQNCVSSSSVSFG
jgi:hypothetical protein